MFYFFTDKSLTIVFLSAGIALDRCLVVKLKHRYKFIVTRNRMIAAICTIWTIALLMVYPVPKLLICRPYHFRYLKSRKMCVTADNRPPTVIYTATNNTNTGVDYLQSSFRADHVSNIVDTWAGQDGCKKIVAFVESIALIAVPVLIVFFSSVVLIVGLYRKLCSQSRVVRRSVETVVVMMVGFNCCVLPYCVTVPIKPAEIGGPGMLLLIYLMQLHSTINPLIYLLRSSKFRRQAIVIGSEFIRTIDKRPQLMSIRQSFKRRPVD